MNGHASVKWIIVTGPQRSGTTLLQTALVSVIGCGPNLAEAHTLCDLLSLLKRGRQQWAKTEDFFSDDADLFAYVRSAIDAVLGRLVQRYPDVPIVVLKDPGFVQVARELKEVLPQAALLCSIRDPRDIAASYVKIGEREAMAEKPSKYQARNIAFIASKIKQSLDAIAEADAAGLFRLIRYEDVVENAESALGAVCREWALPFDASGLQDMRWLEADKRHQQAWISELEERGVSRQSLGNYRTVLTADEIRCVEKKCSDWMRSYGYETADLGDLPRQAAT